MAYYFDPSQLAATDGRLRQHYEDLAKAKTLEDAQRRLLDPTVNRTAVRPRAAEEAGIRRQDARVEVRRSASPNPGEELEIAVYSLMRPGNFKRVLLDRRSPTAAVQIAAGACCEALCAEFGDPFDPSQAADAAKTAYAALVDSL